MHGTADAGPEERSPEFGLTKRRYRLNELIVEKFGEDRVVDTSSLDAFEEDGLHLTKRGLRGARKTDLSCLPRRDEALSAVEEDAPAPTRPDADAQNGSGADAKTAPAPDATPDPKSCGARRPGPHEENPRPPSPPLPPGRRRMDVRMGAGRAWGHAEPAAAEEDKHGKQTQKLYTQSSISSGWHQGASAPRRAMPGPAGRPCTSCAASPNVACQCMSRDLI